MRCTIIKLTMGLALAGCTINATHIAVENSVPVVPASAAIAPLVVPVVTKESSVPVEPTQPAEPTVPNCKRYVPLPVPEPVKIDLAKLKAAKNSLELNSLLLKNVRTLHKQLTNYGKQSTKHYKEYVRKCGSK